MDNFDKRHIDELAKGMKHTAQGLTGMLELASSKLKTQSAGLDQNKVKQNAEAFCEAKEALDKAFDQMAEINKKFNTAMD